MTDVAVKCISLAIAAGLLASSAGGEWWKAVLVGILVLIYVAFDDDERRVFRNRMEARKSN